MAASLSLNYNEIRQKVGRYLGYWGEGKTAAQWLAALTDKQSYDINDCIESGLRQFYGAKDWNFLHKTATIATVINDDEYDLPTDYGGIESQFTYAAGDGYVDVKIVSVSRIESLYNADDSTGVPQCAAIRNKTFDQTAEQLWEVWFWPKPDAVHTLTYHYKAFAEKLDSTKNLYPLGGMEHAETLLHSCLAVAEQRFRNELGLENQVYRECLQRSFAKDDKMNTARFLGRNRDGSDGYGSYQHLLTAYQTVHPDASNYQAPV